MVESDRETLNALIEALRRRPFLCGAHGAIAADLRRAAEQDDEAISKLTQTCLRDPGEPVLLEMLRRPAPRSLEEARQLVAGLRATNPAPTKAGMTVDDRMPWPFAFGPSHIRNWYTPSPGDWRDEVFYFLLVDRFSDAHEDPAKLIGNDLTTATGRECIARLSEGHDWSGWEESGHERYQGGTLRGVLSKLDYLKGLGVTTIWLSPVLQQCVTSESYHGYGIQNFLDVDPHFGTRADLCLLVAEAHNRSMRVILDVIFNHTGMVFTYVHPDGKREDTPPYTSGSYDEATFKPLGEDGQPLDPQQGGGFRRFDYIYPLELRSSASFVRAGTGNLGEGKVFDTVAEHKRTDFLSLRKLNLYNKETLDTIIESYKWLIALSDVDGLRIDTFKHTTPEQATTFTSALKEFTERIRKHAFFLVAECAGGDEWQINYSTVVGRWLDAVLDIGEQRCNEERLAKGIVDPMPYFSGYNNLTNNTLNPIGCLRNFGYRHLNVVNDHDHVCGPKLRFAANACNNHQYTVAAALQLFTLGIPCLYYGCEQNLASGVAGGDSQPGNADWLLREAMFGPSHAIKRGLGGVGANTEDPSRIDDGVVGFGPHHTSGFHAFNTDSPVYERIAALSLVRASFKALRRGRQYPRVHFGTDSLGSPGDLFCWTRVLGEEEVLIVCNPHGMNTQTGRFNLDADVAKKQNYCVAWYTGCAKQAADYEGTSVTEELLKNAPTYKALTPVPVSRKGDREFWVEVTLLPSEVLVISSARAIYFAKKKHYFLQHADRTQLCSYGAFKKWFENSTDAVALDLFRSFVSASPWAAFVEKPREKAKR
eukprot:TRINITY_DN998_c0_g1_i3.p1 TRINITY_DN998_c0_g1~~TRINITY_DN998_c0_g1_i3.p1  ORF type:complete len:830 (+),score=187.26 TRINITY_DN998_c0_g1_i3:33-2492(+)